MIGIDKEIKLYNTQYQDSMRRLKYSNQTLCSKSSIIRFLIKHRDNIQKENIFAKIYNPYRNLQETLILQNDGIILGHLDSSVLFPGTQVIALGVMECSY